MRWCQPGMNLQELIPYLLALALGLLIGLQREQTKRTIAGIRTYPLMALLGTGCASLGSWQGAAGLVVLGAVLVICPLYAKNREDDGPGITTEVSSLVTYMIGALLANDHEGPALVVAGATLVLLQGKQPLHHFSDTLTGKELRAIARLSLIALIILPLLPNKAMGPYEAINPFKIWLMVVLIVGISLTAYFVSKFLGSQKGILATGVLGGLISSTATTVSISRQSKENETSAVGLTAVVLMISSTIVFGRVIFEIWLMAKGHFAAMVPPIAAMMAWMGLLTMLVYRFSDRSTVRENASEPPSDLAAATIFALLYALVLLGIEAAKIHFGDKGVYGIAFISGLTDMDAITLSTSQMVTEGKLTSTTGWRAILLGGMANLLFKAGIVASLGPRKLFGTICALFGASILGGIALMVFWR